MTDIEIRRIDAESNFFLLDATKEEFQGQLENFLVCKLTEFMDEDGAENICDYSHYICSSSLDIVCSSNWITAESLCHSIYKRTGIKTSFSNANQCATWGFLARYHLLHKPNIRNIFLSIVDANPLGMRFWNNNPSWGKSNFCVTNIHLRLLDDTQAACLTIGKCNPEVMLYDYAGLLRERARNFTGRTIVPPFFDEKMRKGLSRVLKDFNHLPDQFEKFGHLYGSDPWVSLSLAIKDGMKGNKFVLSSIASEGYYCFLSAQVPINIKTKELILS